LKAPHSKFDNGYSRLSLFIPESPNLWALFEYPSVPHPFLSPLVPRRSIAISVANGPQLFSWPQVGFFIVWTPAKLLRQPSSFIATAMARKNSGWAGDICISGRGEKDALYLTAGTFD
jgi:hypothetical protein